MSTNVIGVGSGVVSAPSSAALPQILYRVGSSFLSLCMRMSALGRKIQVRQKKKRLRICESIPLGDKRFVAVIQIDDQQFLLGASATSISLLAQLQKPAEFTEILNARVHEANGR